MALLPDYLKALADSSLRAAGDPVVENRRTVSELWHGQRLSGLWLTERAIARASDMAREHGTGTVVIKHAHHRLSGRLPRSARSCRLAGDGCKAPIPRARAWRRMAASRRS